jgi:hypothetical protein
MFPWGFDLVFFGISLVWGQDLHQPSYLHVLGVLILFWNQFRWGRSARSLSFSSLAHVPLGFDLVFLESSLSVGSGSRAFPFHLRMFPWGFFDLVFWNQFSVGSGSARSLSFLTCTCSLGVFFVLVFWNQFSVGWDLRFPFSFPPRVPWGFDLVESV